MIDVTILLLHGGMPSTSLAPLEIFACAGTLWGELRGEPAAPLFRVRTASVDGLTTRNFVPVGLTPTVPLSEVKRTDLVVVPTVGADIEVGVRDNLAVVDWLARRAGPKTAIAGICTGVSLLAAAGLLDGKPATSHWALIDRCRALYPRVNWDPQRFITEADNVFCGGGVYASIDISLYLVERYCGHEVAVQTAKSLLLEAPRLWQTGYAEPPRAAHHDEDIQRAQNWLVSNFKRELRFDDLALRLGMSPRNFARRFKHATGDTPLAYLQRLRVDAARRMLERDQRPVQAVSVAVGYEDVAFFRSLFQRHTGVSPRTYRARFGRRAFLRRA